MHSSGRITGNGAYAGVVVVCFHEGLCVSSESVLVLVLLTRLPRRGQIVVFVKVSQILGSCPRYQRLRLPHRGGVERNLALIACGFVPLGAVVLGASGCALGN